MRKLLPIVAIVLLPAVCVAQDHEHVSQLMISAWDGNRAALEELRSIADGGNPEAQFDMGQAYENGWSVSVDVTQAVEWYLKAAEQGYWYAQFNLGVLYANGKGIPKNASLAALWYRKAAEQDRIEAQINLALMYETGAGIPQDFAEAAKWFSKAAASGNSLAQNRLGTMYASGHGVARDITRAMDLNLKAAEQGLVESMYFVATMYVLGGDVPKDLAKAASWFARAIDAFGNAEAGVADWVRESRKYQLGNDRYKSPVISHMWLDLAVMKGDKAAKRQRASAERNMSSDQIAEAKRLFALLQEVGPSKLSMPQIGAKVSPDVMNARNRSQVCRVDTNRNDPCALVKIRGALITVAWNQRSKTVTYLFTEDTSFVTDSELSLGGSCRIAESRSEPIHYLDWLLTPDWADTAHYVSGYTTAWYAALRTDGEYPGYGRIAGFVQSRYAKFKR